MKEFEGTIFMSWMLIQEIIVSENDMDGGAHAVVFAH